MSELAREELLELQRKNGIYLVVKPDGKAKSIQPDCAPPPGCVVVAVKGVKGLEAAKDELKLAQQAAAMDQDRLDAIEEEDPGLAGRLRRSLRRVKEVARGG